MSKKNMSLVAIVFLEITTTIIISLLPTSWFQLYKLHFSNILILPEIGTSIALFLGMISMTLMTIMFVHKEILQKLIILNISKVLLIVMYIILIYFFKDLFLLLSSIFLIHLLVVVSVIFYYDIQ